MPTTTEKPKNTIIMNDFNESEAIQAINRILILRKMSYRKLALDMGRDVSVLTKVLNRPDDTRRTLTRKNALAISMALGFNDIIELINSVEQKRTDTEIVANEPAPVYKTTGKDGIIISKVKNMLQELKDLQALLLTQD